MEKVSAEALAKEDLRSLTPNIPHATMFYIYLIRSIPNPDRTYIGLTSDLKARLKKHNEGGSPHTTKFKPWDLIQYSAFNTRDKASDFETYLKSGSGRAFAKRRFW